LRLKDYSENINPENPIIRGILIQTMAGKAGGKQRVIQWRHCDMNNPL
jgi:hypothetical protein